MKDFYHGKTVLVTGGTGFVGSHIAEALSARGARVRVPIHSRPLPITDTSIETVAADLTREDDCLRLSAGVDYVFHAAGAVGSAAVRGNRLMATISTNLVLSSLMLQAAWTAKVKRFLLFGSSTAYPPSDRPVKEDELWSAPPYPAYFGYGWMRRYLEKLGEFVHRMSDTAVVVVRPSAVYGERDNFDPGTCHVIPALIRRSIERENPFVVWGSGEEVRDFLHVSDLAAGCLLALESPDDPSPVNIAAGRDATIRRLVRIILDASGHGDAEVAFDASKPGTIPARRMDISRAREVLGFEPAVSLEQGVADTVKWYKETGASA